MFAILTKYHGPTDTRGARISAKFSVGGGRVSIDYPHELNGEACHEYAARALIARTDSSFCIVGSADMPRGFVFFVR